jgi:hypothetical protein
VAMDLGLSSSPVSPHLSSPSKRPRPPTDGLALTPPEPKKPLDFRAALVSGNTQS